MSRLFIDVDDTLVLWKYTGLVDEGYEPNHAVIEFARRWKEFHPEGRIVVWSTGGKDYAGEWRQKLLPFASGWESKYPIHVSPGDLFIDDDPLPWFREATIHPDMLRHLP